jgi:hypothetical protein
MNSIDFIKIIKKTVYDTCIINCLKILEKPPGKKPKQDIVLLSNWFNNLADDEKNKVKSIIAMSAKDSIFGFLSVLDGVRQIENFDSKAKLELRFIDDQHVIIINSSEEDFLHDLFNQELESE